MLSVGGCQGFLFQSSHKFGFLCITPVASLTFQELYTKDACSNAGQSVLLSAPTHELHHKK